MVVSGHEIRHISDPLGRFRGGRGDIRDGVQGVRCEGLRADHYHRLTAAANFQPNGRQQLAGTHPGRNSRLSAVHPTGNPIALAALFGGNRATGS